MALFDVILTPYVVNLLATKLVFIRSENRITVTVLKDTKITVSVILAGKLQCY